MDTSLYRRALPALLIAACLLAAGCFEDDTAGPGTPATPAGPLYTAGDVVKNPLSVPGPAWLIIRYNAKSDSYERAIILQNADGTYGYRADNRTDTVPRPVMERVFTLKIGHTDIARVPTAMPFFATTVVTTTAPEKTEATDASANLPAPRVLDIIPNEGEAGSNVTIQNLAGENFVVGARAWLSREQNVIPATNVRYISNTSLICTFVIPTAATAGSWDVTVTNPDGRSGSLTKVFTVRPAPTTGTTTPPPPSGSLSFTAIDPASVSSMGSYRFLITGTGFQTSGGVTRVILKKAGSHDIEGTSVDVSSPTQIQFSAYIPIASKGIWDLVAISPDGTSGRWNSALEVRS